MADFFQRKSRSLKGITDLDLRLIWERQKKTYDVYGENAPCSLCGDELEQDGQLTHIDHIHPRSKGGEDWPDNLQFVCANCNYMKRDITLKRFVRQCVKIQEWSRNSGILDKAEMAEIIQRRWKRESKRATARQRKRKVS